MTEHITVPGSRPSVAIARCEDKSVRISLGVRVANLLAFILPLLGVLAALVLLWQTFREKG